MTSDPPHPKRYLVTGSEVQQLPADVRIVFGRNPNSCNVVIPERNASGIHALLYCRNGHYFIEDLSSLNGTFVNDDRLTQLEELLPNDVIRIWPLEATFADGSHPAVRAHLEEA